MIIWHEYIPYKNPHTNNRAEQTLLRMLTIWKTSLDRKRADRDGKLLIINGLEKIPTPIPLSRYVKIPIPIAIPTLKIPRKIPNTDTELKYRNRPSSIIIILYGALQDVQVCLIIMQEPVQNENS